MMSKSGNIYRPDPKHCHEANKKTQERRFVEIAYELTRVSHLADVRHTGSRNPGELHVTFVSVSSRTRMIKDQPIWIDPRPTRPSHPVGLHDAKGYSQW